MPQVMNIWLTSVNAPQDTDGDAIAFLYRLLEQRPAYANISHHALPTYEQHATFVQLHPYQYWYIIVTDEGMAGSIYLSDKDEIGITIARTFQRRGIAQRAITRLKLMHPRKRYLANVAPNNMPSHALFAKLGGHVIQSTYEITA